MSIYKYEEAIVNKMREITGDDRIIITPSDNMTNIIPRISNDELKLPLIHIIRNSWKLSNNRSHGMKMNGLINDNMPMFKDINYVSSDDGKIHRLHLLPITFSHTFEVWSRTREENDEMIRELLWFFSTMNEFFVNIPYGVDITHKFTLNLEGEVIDNTNIVNQKNAGELFLQAIITNCDDAFLWKSSSHNPTCIDVGLQLKNSLEPIINTQDYNTLTIEEKSKIGD